MVSKNEDEFFAKETAELLGKERAKVEEEDRKAERATHFMKCPKCGSGLIEESYRGSLIDRCPDCDGLWFDAGEIDKMSEVKEDGFAGGVLKSIFRLSGSGK